MKQGKPKIFAGSSELSKESTAAAVSRLKAQGMSTADIAEQLQIETGTVQNIVKETLERLRAEREFYGALILDLELERLDMMQNAIFEQALAGKLPVQDRVRALMEMRAKYLGIYAPTETKITGDATGQVNVTVVYVDEPIERPDDQVTEPARSPEIGSQEQPSL